LDRDLRHADAFGVRDAFDLGDDREIARRELAPERRQAAQPEQPQPAIALTVSSIGVAGSTRCW
jgi:hypothetical protein